MELQERQKRTILERWMAGGIEGQLAEIWWVGSLVVVVGEVESDMVEVGRVGINFWE